MPRAAVYCRLNKHSGFTSLYPYTLRRLPSTAPLYIRVASRSLSRPRVSCAYYCTYEGTTVSYSIILSYFSREGSWYAYYLWTPGEHRLLCWQGTQHPFPTQLHCSRAVAPGERERERERENKRTCCFIMLTARKSLLFFLDISNRKKRLLKSALDPSSTFFTTTIDTLPEQRKLPPRDPPPHSL